MDLQQKVKGILEHLDGWSYVLPDSDIADYHIQREATMKDEHGRSIFISVGWPHTSRVSCKGKLPQNEGVYVSDICSIGFNIERDAKSIAKDIERRLLPNYIERYDHYIEQHHEYQKCKSIVEAHYKRMLQLIGDDNFGRGHVTKSSYIVYEIEGNLNGMDIDIHICDWDVALEIHVPHAIADAIINLLKDWEHSPGYWHHGSKM